MDYMLRTLVSQASDVFSHLAATPCPDRVSALVAEALANEGCLEEALHVARTSEWRGYLDCHIADKVSLLGDPAVSSSRLVREWFPKFLQYVFRRVDEDDFRGYAVVSRISIGNVCARCGESDRAMAAFRAGFETFYLGAGKIDMRRVLGVTRAMNDLGLNDRAVEFIAEAKDFLDRASLTPKPTVLCAVGELAAGLYDLGKPELGCEYLDEIDAALADPQADDFEMGRWFTIPWVRSRISAEMSRVGMAEPVLSWLTSACQSLRPVLENDFYGMRIEKNAWLWYIYAYVALSYALIGKGYHAAEYARAAVAAGHGNLSSLGGMDDDRFLEAIQAAVLAAAFCSRFDIVEEGLLLLQQVRFDFWQDRLRSVLEVGTPPAEAYVVECVKTRLTKSAGKDAEPLFQLLGELALILGDLGVMNQLWTLTGLSRQHH